MRSFIIVSDTHGNLKGIEALAGLFAENDYIVHLGDGAGDMREVFRAYPEKTYVCGGNCDFTPALRDAEIEAEGVKIFCCHGHRYGVKHDLTALAREAKSRGCSVALYGHTHRALISEEEGVLLINPGSLRRPVGEGGSYCYLNIHDGKAVPVIVGESVY